MDFCVAGEFLELGIVHFVLWLDSYRVEQKGKLFIKKKFHLVSKNLNDVRSQVDFLFKTGLSFFGQSVHSGAKKQL
jgi:hypothetical protein